ncbi:MAG: hypothetical protein QOD71_2421 [Thermoleophilaceae bacterium]|nr:hypothetical protein [Thermoleophilaceae bacterium]
MQARDIALSQARGRMAVGAALLLAPGLAGGRWIGDQAEHPAVKVVIRALGVRDLALGLGAAVAIDRGVPARGWFEAAALCDVVDLVATLLGGESIPDRARKSVVVIAGASAIACVALARAVDQPPIPEHVHAPEAELTGHH